MGTKPVKASAVRPEPVSPRVVPVAFEKVSVPMVEAPDTFKLPPWRNPEAVRFVPEALVKFKVGKVP